jgi:hypothetical protein
MTCYKWEVLRETLQQQKRFFSKNILLCEHVDTEFWTEFWLYNLNWTEGCQPKMLYNIKNIIYKLQISTQLGSQLYYETISCK